jgi:hypothetical protein
LGTAAMLMAVAMVASALPAFANSDAANYCHDQSYPYYDLDAGQVFQNRDECVSYFAQNQ